VPFVTTGYTSIVPTPPKLLDAVPADFPMPGTGQHDPPPPKDLLSPNAGKQLVIDVAGEPWARIPLRTEAFVGGEEYAALIADYVAAAIEPVRSRADLGPGLAQDWYVLVGEKIIAIAQRRFSFWWDIEPGWWARTLSRFVLKLPTGVGLSSPWTMQVAIDVAGLPRILLAAAVSAVGKAVGKRGWFYLVAGHSVNAIDGPGGQVVYPGNASAKLPPEDPDGAATAIRQAIVAAVPPDEGARLGGVAIVDANDLGQNVLGRDSDRGHEFFAQLCADNPAGQGREQTPILLCLRASDHSSGGPGRGAGA
jgi:asparagine synthase (glutamine-hydrolysing)